MALGAERREIVRLVLCDGATIAAWRSVVGVALRCTAIRLTSSSYLGRPDIQQFEGQRTRKGVFITTSTFSDARQYAERIDARVIPIDGTELARLMIAHGVRVTRVAVYELKRVDSDFFAEN